MGFVTVEQFVEALKYWNVLEIDRAIKAIEKKFDIKPTQISAQNTSQEVKAVEEQTAFKLFIKDVGPNKISVIKVVKGLFNWGLKESKNNVENASKPLAVDLDKEEVEKLRKELEACGATVEVE